MTKLSYELWCLMRVGRYDTEWIHAGDFDALIDAVDAEKQELRADIAAEVRMIQDPPHKVKVGGKLRDIPGDVIAHRDQKGWVYEDWPQGRPYPTRPV